MESKKRFGNLLLLVTGILLMAFSCNRSDIDAEPPFAITYTLLNQDGITTKSVKSGENFVFSLAITNNSDEDWNVDQVSVVASNFTELYKKTNNGSDSLLGSAYSSAMCSFQSGVLIPGKGTFRVDIPWIADKALTKVPSCDLSANNNEYLPSGRYATKLNGTLKLFRAEATHEIPLKNYNLAFQVQ